MNRLKTHAPKLATKLATAISISLLAFTAQADNQQNSASNGFHHDISFAYIDDNDNSDNTSVLASYRYYLNAVDTDKGPLALNTFLAQSSNIGVNYIKSDLSETTNYQIDGTYVFASKWFIGANYQQINDDSDRWFYPYDESLYGINLGYYFNDTSSISVFYQNQSGSDNYQNPNADSQDWVMNANFDNQADIFGVNLQSYIPMESFSGINLFASWQYRDSNNSNFSQLVANDNDPQRAFTNTNEQTMHHLYLAADFYINNAWSIGANYAWQDVDGTYVIKNSLLPDDSVNHYSNSFNHYGVNTAYWWQVSQHFSAKFSIAKQFNDEFSDSLLLGIDINARF